MTIQFLPLAESLEAQKWLGDSEFVWVRIEDNNVRAVHPIFGGTENTLGPAYLPCEIKAGVIRACGDSPYYLETLQHINGGGFWEEDEPYVAELNYAECGMKANGSGDTEALALFALLKKIKEAE